MSRIIEQIQNIMIIFAHTIIENTVNSCITLAKVPTMTNRNI